MLLFVTLLTLSLLDLSGDRLATSFQLPGRPTTQPPAPPQPACTQLCILFFITSRASTSTTNTPLSATTAPPTEPSTFPPARDSTFHQPEPQTQRFHLPEPESAPPTWSPARASSATMLAGTPDKETVKCRIGTELFCNVFTSFSSQQCL